MQTEDSPIQVSGAKRVDVLKIAEELASMRRQLDDTEAADAESSVTPSCTLNLIVHAAAEEERAPLDELLNAVNEQRSSRTLLLLIDRKATASEINAYASLRCRSFGGRKQFCGEQVTIEAHGPAVNMVASAVAPLLIPDLPVFLWWKDIPHYEDKLFRQLAATSDLVLTDSAAFDRPYDDLRHLARIILERPQSVSITDLNWGRLTAWRTLVASLWDVPDYRAYLDNIDRVVIEYDPPDVAPDEIALKALLAIGWLATLLGWKIEQPGLSKDKDSARFTLHSGERAIYVEKRSLEDKENRDGMIVSLTLSAREARGEFRVALSSDEKRLETEAKIDGVRTIGPVLNYERKSEGQRLNLELDLINRDDLYEQAIVFAAQLIETFADQLIETIE